MPSLPAGGLSLPGLTSLPPLQQSSSASSRLDLSGAFWQGPGSGDWIVNMGGSGVSAQAGAAGLPAWMLLAAVGLAWLALRRR